MLSFQLCLLSLLSFAMAEETVSTANHGNAIRFGTGGGIVGFIVLILDIIVFLEVLKSSRPGLHKVLWCVIVFIFPVIGLIVYWLFSDRAKHAPSSGYDPIP